jgi:hypothetical protein
MARGVESLVSLSEDRDNALCLGKIGEALTIEKLTKDVFVSMFLA